MEPKASLRPTITLTTDFGLRDPYVGIMKGVMTNIIPDVTLINLTHNVSPQDIRQAAFLLSTAIAYFPTGTVHLVVVDPGVGSERRPIAVRTNRACYVAPDNGVLSMALAHDSAEVIVHLTNSDYWLPHVSATFHGRDIFAPAAAHLARGVPLQELGVPIDDIVRLSSSMPSRQPDGSIQGHVLHIDRFGNCITDISADMLSPEIPVYVNVAGHSIQGISTTYADVESGQATSLVGSSGFLEVAVRAGSAADQLNIQLRDTVSVEPQ